MLCLTGHASCFTDSTLDVTEGVNAPHTQLLITSVTDLQLIGQKVIYGVIFWEKNVSYKL